MCDPPSLHRVNVSVCHLAQESFSKHRPSLRQMLPMLEPASQRASEVEYRIKRVLKCFLIFCHRFYILVSSQRLEMGSLIDSVGAL